MSKENYLAQIEYLRANPEVVYETWLDGGRKEDSLFAFVAIDPANDLPATGCLTMIRDGNFFSEFGPEHSEQIRDDERIPRKTDCDSDSEEEFVEALLAPGVLEVFMEHQLDIAEKRKQLKRGILS